MRNTRSFSEGDIRPDTLMADKQRLVDEDREFLLSRMEEWVSVPCPACGRGGYAPKGEKAGFCYVECEDCKTVYTNPRPSRALLLEFYAGSKNYEYWNMHIFPATEETRRECIFRPRALEVQRYCRELGLEGRTLLEVGAGYGIFCEEASKLGTFDRIIAIEPTPDLAETCRRKGFEVINGTVELVPADVSADVVAAFEVIEHLFSPYEFLGHCFRTLRPGGLLILSCPNVRGFDVDTLGMLSNTFDHEHLNYFHTGSLPQLVERCGYEVRDIKTPGRLDAGIVRRHVLEGRFDLGGQPFLEEVLVRRWDELGETFQDFLASSLLSSHMWVVAQKTRPQGKI